MKQVSTFFLSIFAAMVVFGVSSIAFAGTEYEQVPTTGEEAVGVQRSTDPSLTEVKRVTIDETSRKRVTDQFDPRFKEVITDDAEYMTEAKEQHLYTIKITNTSELYPLHFQVGSIVGKVKPGKEVIFKDKTWKSQVGIELSKSTVDVKSRFCCFLFDDTEYSGEGTLVIYQQKKD